jgi:hypothetical protein
MDLLGNFGAVYKGQMGMISVALKTIKNEDIAELVRETQMLR